MLLILVVASLSGVLRPLEQLLYTTTRDHFAPTERSGKVVVVSIPERGVTPHRFTQLLERLGRARAIGVVTPPVELGNDNAIAALDWHLDRLSSKQKRGKAEPYTTLRSLRHSLDGEAKLNKQLKGRRQLVAATPYRPAEAATTALQQRLFGLAPMAGHWLVDRLPGPTTPSQPRLDETATGSAVVSGTTHTGLLAGSHGIAFPTLVASGESPSPTLLFQLLRLNYKAMDDGKMGLLPGHGIRLGKAQLPTDRGFRLYPYSRLGDGALGGLRHYTLDALLAEKPSSKRFRNKLVLVGDLGDNSPLPAQALALDAALQKQLVAIPGWSLWASHGALLLVALLVMWVLPRLRLSTGGVTVALVALLLVMSEFLALLLTRQWLPLMLPLMLLLFSFPLVALRGYLTGHHEWLSSELSLANRELGRMLQGQGELDEALERYRRCRPDGDLHELLYTLGLDYERKRQFARAVSVFELIGEEDRGFRDCAERLEKNRAMEQRVVLAGGGPTAPGGTVIMDAEGLQNPTLGPYQIEREIGRGAMGMVYLGNDPRIGREVAIKTMALSAEFDGDMLEEVKERFYREAETAGRLNHPNIVHVYDIGEEQELAYIAMDYLKGEPLNLYTPEKKLLPIKEVLAIVEQVAEALEYAHKQGVVHRDIKPANIIYDKKEKVTKVTDFGVAFLSDSSKTKTGTVLGSPSYMSPEQVAGKKVDGRADIFSLGVTLYQLVTGHLPFEADSLGALMYQIATEPHPKPGKYRKGIPTCVTRIINKCMQKEKEDRYQSGAELAAALGRCRR